MNVLPSPWNLVIPVALGALAIRLLLPREGRRSLGLGGLLGLVAVVMVLGEFGPGLDEWSLQGLFYLFAGGAIVSGGMMITDRNPVYSALWFALVTLSTCGLFLLNSAPFLSAATIVVYAGAIIVTFLFVIMLAQQEGATGYDGTAFQPGLATAGAFLLAAVLLHTLHAWSGLSGNEEAIAKFLPVPDSVVTNPLSEPIGDDLGSLRGVGRSLFGDYLYSVELAGTVLLMATVGAIALAPRRAQGQL